MLTRAEVDGFCWRWSLVLTTFIIDSFEYQQTNAGGPVDRCWRRPVLMTTDRLSRVPVSTDDLLMLTVRIATNEDVNGFGYRCFLVLDGVYCRKFLKVTASGQQCLCRQRVECLLLLSCVD